MAVYGPVGEGDRLMEVDAGLAAVLRELEEEMLTISGRRDGARLRELLAEDFRESGSSGRVWTREDIVAELSVEVGASISMTEFRAEAAGDGVVLVTYRARREGAAGVRETLRASLWVRRDGAWRMIFHQGTLVPAEAAGG